MPAEAATTVIGMTDHDQMMGRMIERTDQLMRQAQKTDGAIESLTAMMGGVRETLAKLDVTVTNLGAIYAGYHDMDARLREMEDLKSDIVSAVEFKNVILKWGIIAGLVAVAGGSTLGQVMTHVLHILE
jgi:hypothetical protein